MKHSPFEMGLSSAEVIARRLEDEMLLSRLHVSRA